MGLSNRSGATPKQVALMLYEVSANLDKRITELSKKLDNYETRNSENLRKLLLMVSELYHQGRINDDTFNRLDEFLHEWLDSTIKTE